MQNGISGIDHVIVGVADLDSAQRSWTRLGFAVSPRGRHIGQGTANFCIMFPADYIELLGIVDPADFTQRLDTFLNSHGEGPMGLAFGMSGAPDATCAALASLGLHPSVPRALARQFEAPEGTVLPRFSLVDLPAPEIPGINAFLCAHLTPELLRRPEWLQHPNGVTGLWGVHVLVEATVPLLPAYDRLFGLHKVTTTDAIACVQAGRHRILFSTPDDFLAMHPGLVPDFELPTPRILALELTTADREKTADYLAQWQISFEEMPDGSLVVPADQANGTILMIAER